MNSKKHISIQRKMIYAVMTGALVTIGLELLLYLLAGIFPTISTILSPPPSPVIEDARLVYRPNPAHPEHDQRGFRNPIERTQVAILAQGDSQTYGAGVSSDQAWPRVLEKLSQKEVYNMGYGGYGSVHHLLLWEEAMELSPKAIVHTIYTGNDLYDAFSLVYDYHQLPQLKSNAIEVQKNISALEKEAPLRETITRLFSSLSEGKPEDRGLRFYLSNYSKLYGLLRSCRHTLLRYSEDEGETLQEWEALKVFALRQQAHYEVFENDSFRTLFTCNYRKGAMEIEDPRIEEGLAIILRVIEEMKQRADHLGVPFYVLGIPTKEFLFKHYVDAASPEYLELISVEEEIWKRIEEALETMSIPYIDGEKAVSRGFEQGKQPFHQSADGHLNILGHQLIAEEVHRFLEKN